MTDQPDRPRTVIQNREQLDEVIKRMAELSRDKAGIELEIAQRVGDAQADGARRTKSIDEELAEYEPSVWDYVDRHPELFDDGQDVILTDGVLTRTSSTRNTILDMKRLVKAVRDVGESSLVQIVESVSVNAIKARKGVLDKVLKRDPNAIRSDRYWNFTLSISPKDTKAKKGAVPKPLKHDLPRTDPLEPDLSD